MANRLADETSPYLLQHKDNPVDWYPWNDHALDKARREGKPILLSIGYAACHWCHVMAHESFEDDHTAAFMNEHFVNVKVDREERPDLDAIYMDAVQAMTGQGGWPMTMFLTPDGAPFYGGTYYPPVDARGMPSFRRVLDAIAEAWEARRDEVESHGRELVRHLNDAVLMRPSDEPIGESIFTTVWERLRSAFDPLHGGFGGAPKFPQPMTVDLLLRLGARSAGPPDEESRSEPWAMASKTLDAMAAGGMFDQLGGGFSRYSVDRQWIVPHFEKMLYDNAQLLRTCARSWQATGSLRHRAVAEATAAWMLAEMRDPAGGFWSSLDADSEGEEGKYYVWSLDEVRAVAGPDAGDANAHFGFTEGGNFEGRNIPVFANGGDPEAAERARRALLEARGRRVRPATDTKVITAWNALAASALAESGSALDRAEWVEAAAEAMRFVLSTLRVNGRLMRSYRAVEAGAPAVKHLGYCEDYAFSLEACLSLYEATSDIAWLEEARGAADEALRLFLDHETGGFFTTGSDAPALVTRSKEFIDNAVPSANSVMAMELQRLATLTGERAYEQHAVAVIRLVLDAALRSSTAFGHLLGAVDYYLATPAEIVVVGDRDDTGTAELLGAVRSLYIPNKVVVVADIAGADQAKLIPLLEGKTKLEGKATAYVCRNGTCKSPVGTPVELIKELVLR